MMENISNNKKNSFNLYLSLYITFFLFLLLIVSILYSSHDTLYACNYGSTLGLCGEG